MNVFAGKSAGVFLDLMLPEIKAAASESKEPNQTRGSPDGKASMETFWYPDLTQKEWDLLNYRLNRELETSDNFIDKATKWLYADSRGTTVFAIYGIGDGTEATVLYAVGGAKAQNMNARREEYEANINGAKRNAYKKNLERLGVEQNQYGNGANRNRQDVAQTDSGVGSVSSGEQRGHNGGTVLNDSTQGKASRELDTEYLSAVNRGDMETAQRMVDEAAKKVGKAHYRSHSSPLLKKHKTKRSLESDLFVLAGAEGKKAKNS